LEQKLSFVEAWREKKHGRQGDGEKKRGNKKYTGGAIRTKKGSRQHGGGGGTGNRKDEEVCIWNSTKKTKTKKGRGGSRWRLKCLHAAAKRTESSCRGETKTGETIENKNKQKKKKKKASKNVKKKIWQKGGKRL